MSVDEITHGKWPYFCNNVYLLRTQDSVSSLFFTPTNQEWFSLFYMVRRAEKWGWRQQQQHRQVPSKVWLRFSGHVWVHPRAGCQCCPYTDGIHFLSPDNNTQMLSCNVASFTSCQMNCFSLMPTPLWVAFFISSN